MGRACLVIFLFYLLPRFSLFRVSFPYGVISCFFCSPIDFLPMDIQGKPLSFLINRLTSATEIFSSEAVSAIVKSFITTFFCLLGRFVFGYHKATKVE
jgi:hypothetical protein